MSVDGYERLMVPDGFTCPRWCIRQHQEALDEGCAWEDARVHTTGDLGGSLHRHVNKFSGQEMRRADSSWQLIGRADPGNHIGTGPAIVEVSLGTSARGGGTIRAELTSGEARTMAAQLLHLADKIDLHG